MKGNIVPLSADAPKEGETYRHYKGDSYQVNALALFTRDYFHPDAEKAMQEAAAELLAMPAPRPGEKRVVQ